MDLLLILGIIFGIYSTYKFFKEEFEPLSVYSLALIVLCLFILYSRHKNGI
jgi:multidrug transporter EmrE-like cation transporter